MDPSVLIPNPYMLPSKREFSKKRLFIVVVIAVNFFAVPLFCVQQIAFFGPVSEHFFQHYRIQHFDEQCVLVWV